MNTLILQFFIIVVIQSSIPIFLKKFKFNKYMASLCGAVITIIVATAWNFYEHRKKGESYGLLDEYHEIVRDTSLPLFLLACWSWFKDTLRLFFYSKMAASFVKGSSSLMTVSAFLADSYLFNHSLTLIQKLCIGLLTGATVAWSYIRDKKNKNKNMFKWIIVLFLTRIVDGISGVEKKQFIDKISTQSYTILFASVFAVFNIICLTYNSEWNTFTKETFLLYGVLSTFVFIANIFYRKKISNTVYFSMSAMSPAIVAILSRFFLKEQLGNIEWFLIALIIGSIVTIEVIEDKTKTKKKEKQEATATNKFLSLDKKKK